MRGTSLVSPRADAAASWLVESKSAWISPSQKLTIPVPVDETARFLSLSFEVLYGNCVDFDVMLENADEDQGAIRLYGPSRRAHSVRTVLPLPHAGVAYATFDSFSSWLTSVQIKYSMRLSTEEPSEQV